MNYIASITDFFKSPKWMMNLLLAGLCAFIPVVGYMVVLGWLITGFWGRQNDAPESFPDFDFNNFGKWLERGLWPILVSLVAGIVVYFFFMIPMFVVITVLGGGSHDHQHVNGLMSLISALVILGMQLFMFLTMVFVVKPLMIKATLAQDFVKAFDIAFIKSFVSLVWIELLLSTLFVGAASLILMLAGSTACCVGVILVPGLVYYSMTHMDKQLYNLYLSRGGAPIELSPKLSDMPPAIPGA